jgi:peptidyl-prolyl cis-trans isomerase C
MIPVTVNGVEIAAAAIHAEMQHHPAASAAEAQAAATRALIVRELLEQEARRLAIADTPDADEIPEEARIRRLIEHAVRVPEPDDETCRRYYANNRGRFRMPDRFEARHILLAAAPDDPDARAAARVRASELLAELAVNPGRFAALAAQHSACPSAKDGGYLGDVTSGSTAPEFETFLMSLDDGETCPQPVETRYGFHIVQLLRRQQGEVLQYEAIRSKIAAFLTDSSRQHALRQYLTILASRATITGAVIGQAGSPLVQ